MPASGKPRRFELKASKPDTDNQVAMGLGVAIPHMRDEGCVYMDYNATTPIYPEVSRIGGHLLSKLTHILWLITQPSSTGVQRS